jgi:hypothetical protein
MNYIIEIKGFYDLVMSKQLSTGQIALWHALMHINNKCAWIEWFTAPISTLKLLTGLSKESIIKNRKILKKIGLVDFKPNGTRATSYSLRDSLQNGLQNGLQDSLQNGLQNGLRDSTPLTKLN